MPSIRDSQPGQKLNNMFNSNLRTDVTNTAAQQDMSEQGGYEKNSLFPGVAMEEEGSGVTERVKKALNDLRLIVQTAETNSEAVILKIPNCSNLNDIYSRGREFSYQGIIAGRRVGVSRDIGRSARRYMDEKLDIKRYNSSLKISVSYNKYVDKVYLPNGTLIL